MSDQGVFGENTPTDGGNPQEPKNQPPAETPPKSNSDMFADKLTSIVNDKGEPKYKDVETALDALKESQDFIKTLQTEKKTVEEQLAEREEELKKMGNIDDFVNRISPATPQGDPEETPKGESTLSEEKVLELINRTTTQREQASQAANNLNTVVTKLSEQHGGTEKAAAFIQQKAKEFDTTPAELKKLAQSNPTMALQLLGSASKNPEVPASSLKTNSQPPTVDDDGVPKWEKGAARGGLSSKELAARWRAVGEHTHKRLGVEN